MFFYQQHTLIPHTSLSKKYNPSLWRIPKIKQINETETYCKSIWCSSTVGSIEKGVVLSVSVTVTAASLLTGADMWSERSAGGRLALWPCSPEAWSLWPLADVTYWSRLSCGVTACYPLPSDNTHAQTQTHKTTPSEPPLLLQLLPRNLRPLGDSLTGPCSSALASDWHHQLPIHSTPLQA